MKKNTQFDKKEIIRKEIKRIENMKFPKGERKWCIECFKRIKKEILK